MSEVNLIVKGGEAGAEIVEQVREGITALIRYRLLMKREQQRVLKRLRRKIIEKITVEAATGGG